MNSKRLAAITTFVVIAAFFSVVYTSCKKNEATPVNDQCATVTCQNNGICYKGICTCPSGFDGPRCENVWVNRFLGQWDVEETVTGSSYAPNKGQVRTYVAQIVAKPNDPSAFLINGLKGTNAYNGVVCDMGVNDKYQRASARQFQIRRPQSIGQGINALNFSSGGGTLNDGNTHIEGRYYSYYFNPADSTLITDTTFFTMNFK